MKTIFSLQWHFCILLILGTLCLMMFSVTVNAQPYSVDWHKVSGGGGTSLGSGFSISGTIESNTTQGGPLTGGGYSVTGGFWAAHAVQTPSAPTLTTSYVAHQAIVSWPLSDNGWTLQTNNNLSTGTWGNYLGSVINNSITNSPPVANVFFRLKK